MSDFDFDAMMSDLESDADFAPASDAKSDSASKTCACNGMGCSRCNVAVLKSSFSSRPKRKQKSKAEIEAAKREKAEADFEKREPGLLTFLRENQWSEFFASLLDSFGQYGNLTDRQIQAARSAQARLAERKAQEEAAKSKNRAVVDLSPIKAMFDAAVASGLKRTKYMAEGLELTRAPDHGRNPGAIYVKRLDDAEYVGKVFKGKFEPVSATDADDTAALLRIAENPREAAIRWGQKTGTCSCCGRELTNATSIALGIGPICATKWGL